MNRIKILDNTTIKLIAISIMLFNHIGYVFFDGAPIFLKIGEIGFPLFAFCIAEGFYYTKNRKKYLINMFIYAVLTELLFDYAFYKKIYWLHQNVLFTFSMAILLLLIYEYIRKLKMAEWIKASIFCVIFITFLLLSTFSLTDHNTYGIVLIFIFYTLRDKLIIKYILASIMLYISFDYGYALFSIPILLMYNGKRGLNIKYLFYNFYPMHLFVLAIIREIIA